MKKQILILISALVLCLCLAACSGDTETKSVWTGASYTEDTTIGDGSKSFEFDVTAEDKTVSFVINTDKKTVGEALEECGIIEGEEGPYGLYVKVVNGIEADYDKTKAYWSFTKDSAPMQTGVDGEEIQDGTRYGAVYTK